MTIIQKNALFAGILGVSAMVIAGCSGPKNYNSYGKTNHLRANSVNHSPYNRNMGRYQKANKKARKAQKSKKYDGWRNRLQGRKILAYQTPPPHPGMGAFQRWVDYEPQYTLYPGDQVDIVVASAPELSRTLTVGPDGRVVMPMTTPIMAAGRTFKHIEQELSAQLGKQLRDPRIAISPRAYAPQQIFVGGEVGQQGTYALSGPVGTLEAIIMAGGMRPTAKTSQVAVLRRAPNGGMMMRPVNIKNGMRNIRENNDNMQLRRGDIVFVPRSGIAEVGVFMQNFRAALPIDFNLSYQIGAGNDSGTTVISP